MKIDKLYTLSQFVELLNTKRLHEFQNINLAEKYRLVDKYNNFLKQQLKKEMFINEVKKPSSPRPGLGAMQANAIYKNIELPRWNEAEKKVIFSGWSKSLHRRWYIINGVHEISFEICCFITYTKVNSEKSTLVIETLNDLAEATNGQLTLKNVEL